MNEYEIVKHQKVRGLSVFLNAVDYRTPHEHPEWELIWVLENALHVSCDGSQILLEPGQMVLFAPHELHELRTQGESSVILCMQLAPAVLPIQPHLTLDQRFPHLLIPEDTFLEIKVLIFQLARRFFTGDARYELFCLGQSMLILSLLLEYLPLRECTPAEVVVIKERNARIQRMFRFVEENYMRKTSLTELAKQEGCSVSHLSRLIKAQTNQTFQEYVEYVRFYHACVLIASGSRKMLDVCVNSGFSDYRYFTRAFRKYLNMTPEAYAQSGQNTHTDNGYAHGSVQNEHIFSMENSLAFLDRLLNS